MFKIADKTIKSGIKTKSYFSYPNWDRPHVYTSWDIGPFHLELVEKGVLIDLYGDPIGNSKPSKHWIFKIERKRKF